MLPKDEDPRIIFEFKSNSKEFRVVRLSNDENNKNRYAETKRRYQIQSKNTNSLGESFWLDQDNLLQGDINTYAKTNDTYALVVLLMDRIEFLTGAIGPHTTPMPDISNELDTESVI